MRNNITYAGIMVMLTAACVHDLPNLPDASNQAITITNISPVNIFSMPSELNAPCGHDIPQQWKSSLLTISGQNLPEQYSIGFTLVNAELTDQASIYLSSDDGWEKDSSGTRLIGPVPADLAPGSQLFVSIELSNGQEIKSSQTITVLDSPFIRQLVPTVAFSMQESAQSWFSVTPTLSIMGENFATTYADGTTDTVLVCVNDQVAPVLNKWSDQLKIQLPPNLEPTENYQITVLTPSGSSAWADGSSLKATLVTVAAPIQDLSFTPAAGFAQSVVTITGKGFDPNNQNNHRVFFQRISDDYLPACSSLATNNSLTLQPITCSNQVSPNWIEATVLGATDSTLTVQVPVCAMAGPIAVVTPAGLVCSASTFKAIAPPFVSNFNPKSGYANTTEITIKGSNFDASLAENNTVYFQSSHHESNCSDMGGYLLDCNSDCPITSGSYCFMEGQVLSAKTDTIITIPPIDVISGLVSVQTASGRVFAETVFAVPAAPVIQAIYPQPAYPGNLITIRGAGLWPEVVAHVTCDNNHIASEPLLTATGNAGSIRIPTNDDGVYEMCPTGAIAMLLEDPAGRFSTMEIDIDTQGGRLHSQACQVVGDTSLQGDARDFLFSSHVLHDNIYDTHAIVSYWEDICRYSQANSENSISRIIQIPLIDQEMQTPKKKLLTDVSPAALVKPVYSECFKNLSVECSLPVPIKPVAYNNKLYSLFSIAGTIELVEATLLDGELSFTSLGDLNPVGLDIETHPVAMTIAPESWLGDPNAPLPGSVLVLMSKVTSTFDRKLEIWEYSSGSVERRLINHNELCITPSIRNDPTNANGVFSMYATMMDGEPTILVGAQFIEYAGSIEESFPYTMFYKFEKDSTPLFYNQATCTEGNTVYPYFIATPNTHFDIAKISNIPGAEVWIGLATDPLSGAWPIQFIHDGSSLSATPASQGATLPESIIATTINNNVLGLSGSPIFNILGKGEFLEAEASLLPPINGEWYIHQRQLGFGLQGELNRGAIHTFNDGSYIIADGVLKYCTIPSDLQDAIALQNENQKRGFTNIIDPYEIFDGDLIVDIQHYNNEDLLSGKITFLPTEHRLISVFTDGQSMCLQELESTTGQQWDISFKACDLFDQATDSLFGTHYDDLITQQPVEVSSLAVDITGSILAITSDVALYILVKTPEGWKVTFAEAGFWGDAQFSPDGVALFATRQDMGRTIRFDLTVTDSWSVSFQETPFILFVPNLIQPLPNNNKILVFNTLSSNAIVVDFTNLEQDEFQPIPLSGVADTLYVTNAYLLSGYLSTEPPTVGFIALDNQASMGNMPLAIDGAQFYENGTWAASAPNDTQLLSRFQYQLETELLSSSITIPFHFERFSVNSDEMERDLDMLISTMILDAAIAPNGELVTLLSNDGYIYFMRGI